MNNHKPRSRKLHIRWVNAAERRLIARVLNDAGFSHRHIAELLEVSPTTVSNDIHRA